MTQWLDRDGEALDVGDTVVLKITHATGFYEYEAEIVWRNKDGKVRARYDDWYGRKQTSTVSPQQCALLRRAA
jgi:hypothetical protein